MPLFHYMVRLDLYSLLFLEFALEKVVDINLELFLVSPPSTFQAGWADIKRWSEKNCRPLIGHRESSLESSLVQHETSCTNSDRNFLFFLNMMSHQFHVASLWWLSKNPPISDMLSRSRSTFFFCLNAKLS